MPPSFNNKDKEKDKEKEKEKEKEVSGMDSLMQLRGNPALNRSRQKNNTSMTSQS